MYTKMDEVNTVIEEFVKADRPNHHYVTYVTRFFNLYMGKEENRKKPLDSITSYDVNNFLGEVLKLKREGQTYRTWLSAFNKFFTYTYKQKITGDVMKEVLEPIKSEKEKEEIPQNDLDKLMSFTVDNSQKMVERLLVAFHLHTGLSRSTIAKLEHCNINISSKERNLQFKGDEGTIFIPISLKLAELLSEYLNGIGSKDNFSKLFDFDENYLSSKLSSLTSKITGIAYTQKHFTTTFIRKCLRNGLDIALISKLVQQTAANIVSYVEEREEPLILSDDEEKKLNELF